MSGRVRGGVVVAVVIAVAWVLVPGVASAHGATQAPTSRGFACGPEGGKLNTMPACKAAIANSGSLDTWDSIRVANVGGQDRTVIPDGKICSGGISKYHGLDLARADWPATNLTPGATYTFSYRTTIPHQGVFRMYLTNSSYAPTSPLRWANLDPTPFLTVNDPKVQGSAYVMKGRLPSGRTGRQLILVIWQNTSTPDTYYSCSDVVFPTAPAPPSAQQPPPVVPSANAVPTSVAPAPVPSTVPSPPTDALAPVASNQPTGRGLLPIVAAVCVAVVAIAVLGTVLRRRRRTSS